MTRLLKAAVMRPEEGLDRLGGIADAGMLLRLSSRGAVRRAVREGRVVRDSRGRYSLPAADEGRRAANELSGVASHLSAAMAHGWEVKAPPERPQVMVPRNRKVDVERRDGVEVRWRDLRADESNRRVTTAGRTVTDCARDLCFDEALAVADSALRHGNVTKPRLTQLAEMVPSRYRPRCRRVAQHADGRAANPFESVLRALAIEAGLRVVPQVVIAQGDLRVRPDLVDEGRRLVLEADSYQFHGSRKALLRDCERYDALVLHGWTVLRFGWEHVMFRPEHVLACLTRATRTCGAADSHRLTSYDGRSLHVRPAQRRVEARTTSSGV